MTNSRKTSLSFLLLDFLLILALLTLAAAGAGLYRAALDAQQLHAQQRSALSYIQSQGALCRGGVAVQPGENGDVLLLTQPGESYTTHIYLYEGTLRSQLVPADVHPDPENGDVLCRMDHLSLNWIDRDLLQIQTDSGTAYLHSWGGEDHA